MESPVQKDTAPICSLPALDESPPPLRHQTIQKSELKQPESLLLHYQTQVAHSPEDRQASQSLDLQTTPPTATNLAVSAQQARNSQYTPEAPNVQQTTLGRTRVKRAVFSRRQVAVMESCFTQKSFVTREERRELARELGITERQVLTWFQNRRGRLRKRGQSDAAYTEQKAEEVKTGGRSYPILYQMAAVKSKEAKAFYERTVAGGKSSPSSAESTPETSPSSSYAAPHLPTYHPGYVAGYCQGRSVTPYSQMTIQIPAAGTSAYPWTAGMIPQQPQWLPWYQYGYVTPPTPSAPRQELPVQQSPLSADEDTVCSPTDEALAPWTLPDAVTLPSITTPVSTDPTDNWPSCKFNKD